MISRSDLPQLNATLLHEMRIPYEYLTVTISAIKPIKVIGSLLMIIDILKDM